MKSIGIVGLGFVGSAIREGMKHSFCILGYDRNDPNVVYRWDNFREIIEHPDESGQQPLEYMVTKADGPIFLCLPTPMNGDGSCNVEIVRSVLSKLNKFSKGNKVVVIKSTIIVGSTDSFNEEFKNIEVVFNPEFLTERNAVEDFKNQDKIILGGNKNAVKYVSDMYKQAYPGIPIIQTSAKVAEMVKYMTNCFLAVKVSFANEIKQICDQMSIDYDKVIEYRDERLGDSHLAVPGPCPANINNKKQYLSGFSGSCIPKDLNALMAKSFELNVDPKMMKAAWEKNLEVRPEKDWEYLIGRAVLEEQFLD